MKRNDIVTKNGDRSKTKYRVLSVSDDKRVASVIKDGSEPVGRWVGEPMEPGEPTEILYAAQLTKVKQSLEESNSSAFPSHS